MSNFCDRPILLKNFIANVNNVRRMISYSDAHFSPIERAVLDWCLSQVPDNVVDMSESDFEKLLNHNHLDATHIGTKDLPYFYKKFGNYWYHYDTSKFEWVKCEDDFDSKNILALGLEFPR